MIVRRHRRREIDENRQDGVLFLVGSLAVVALLHLLTWLFPDTWGGTNILTGLLILGGYFGMVIGLVLLLASLRPWIRHRRKKPRR